MKNYIHISFTDEDGCKVCHNIHKDIIGDIVTCENSSECECQVSITSKTGEIIIDETFKDPYQFDNFVANIYNQLKEN